MLAVHQQAQARFALLQAVLEGLDVEEARELVPAAQAVCRVVAAAFGDTAVLRLVDGPRGVRIVGAAGPSPEIVDEVVQVTDDESFAWARRLHKE